LYSSHLIYKNCSGILSHFSPFKKRNDLQFLEGIVDIKEKLQLPFAMDIIMLAAWGIWIVRNNKIFNNISASFQSWKAIYLQEIRLISYRMKKKHASSFKEWLQSRT
jgi:hypothetical protein